MRLPIAAKNRFCSTRHEDLETAYVGDRETAYPTLWTCKETADVNVRVTLIGSISSNHAKRMQESANALLVSFTKFDEP